MPRITFEGQNFETLADWQRAYPLYARFTADLRAGADTVMEMEKRRAQRLKVANIKRRDAARRQNKPRGIVG